MTANAKLGKQGEELAVAFLKQRGFSILEKNWRIKHKEIDIIASKEGVLHIVEVKSRKNDFLVEPELSVTKRKQKLLIRAADAYIRRKKLRHDVQFDIISVVQYGTEFKINHIEDAYYVTL